MKSKSFNLKTCPDEKGKPNSSFDFGSLYKPAGEYNTKRSEIGGGGDSIKKDNVFDSNHKNYTPKRGRSPNKKKKNKYNIFDVDSASAKSTVANAFSTPLPASKVADRTPKSIMKNSSGPDDEVMDRSNPETPSTKPKKRNKSVSFMLEDNEEVAAVKKSKSEESNEHKKHSKNKKNDKKKFKKSKKTLQDEKENANMNMEAEVLASENITKKKHKHSKTLLTDSSTTDNETVKAKKHKKYRKQKAEPSAEPIENESSNTEDPNLIKAKKSKKKKRHAKPNTDTTMSDEEPATKTRKKDDAIPEVIAEDLENLTIGDNAHTLTNLLDEMSVLDKNKKKKNKVKRKKDKDIKTPSVSSSETADLEKIEEGKEKVKWKKRKWNKDKKGDVEDVLVTLVIVEHLPLSIMCTYKRILSEHFGKIGQIKKIGIAEVYPAEEPKPVFTTTVQFYSEVAATEALEQDNTVLEGSRIRIRRPLPPTQTTLVVRSYAELSEQALSSVFSAAGRVRSIKHLVKGKKAIATAFIEFDGPEAVERAIKMADDARIGGKKIHVSKFEQRGLKTKTKRVANTKTNDSENEGDSEDSND